MTRSKYALTVADVPTLQRLSSLAAKQCADPALAGMETLSHMAWLRALCDALIREMVGDQEVAT